MADVKAQELSLDEWYALLEPYGWADITTHGPAVRFHVPPGLLMHDVRMMLKGSPDGALDEWAHRSYLLAQARTVVEAVQAKGYMLTDAPRIEFTGEYRYRVDTGRVPEWTAAAELSFRVHAA